MGLLHLHSSGLIHRDFKSLNILVTENYDLKVNEHIHNIYIYISILRLVILENVYLRIMSPAKRVKIVFIISIGKVAGTPCYLAPEIIKQQAFDERVNYIYIYIYINV